MRHIGDWLAAKRNSLWCHTIVHCTYLKWWKAMQRENANKQCPDGHAAKKLWIFIHLIIIVYRLDTKREKKYMYFSSLEYWIAFFALHFRRARSKKCMAEQHRSELFLAFLWFLCKRNFRLCGNASIGFLLMSVCVQALSVSKLCQFGTHERNMNLVVVSEHQPKTNEYLVEDKLSILA